MNWYKLSAEEVVKQIGVDPDTGLTNDEAKSRLEKYGPNELTEKDAISPWRILLNQFTELMVIILIIAAIVSVLSPQPPGALWSAPPGRLAGNRDLSGRQPGAVSSQQ